MNEKAFLSKVSKLVDSVRHQGMPERAKQLEAIVEDRIIWAQMVSRPHVREAFRCGGGN